MQSHDVTELVAFVPNPDGSLRVEASIVHLCPPLGSGVTGCCLRTPFELPRDDRMTIDFKLVTCRGF